MEFWDEQCSMDKLPTYDFSRRSSPTSGTEVHDTMHGCGMLTLRHVEPPLSWSICIKKNIEKSPDVSKHEVSKATQHYHFILSYLQPTTQHLAFPWKHYTTPKALELAFCFTLSTFTHYTPEPRTDHATISGAKQKMKPCHFYTLDTCYSYAPRIPSPLARRGRRTS